MTPDNGLGVFLTGLPTALVVDFARAADGRGFRQAWVPEITFGDAFVPIAAASHATGRIALGTGVVGIWSRSPVAMALTAATLHELSGERLLLGVGTQARPYVENWHGRAYERPIRAMREYVTILRAILDGGVATLEGEIFSVRGFQLQMQPPKRRARIYVAAVGPQMIRLAGELADGVLGYFWSQQYVREVVMPELAAGAARAGRSVDEIDIACGYPSVLTGDDSGLALARGQVMMFASAAGSSPAYVESVARAGYGAEAAEIAARVAAGDTEGALAHVSEEMAATLTLSGSPDRVRARVGELRAAGVTTVCLNPAPPGGWFPLYEGHFPPGVELPPFDFPGLLAGVAATVELLGD